ncbi:MAG: gliding motility-associated C-terminal domain-containing protein, partial [Bacteroidia bacterium]
MNRILIVSVLIIFPHMFTGGDIHGDDYRSTGPAPCYTLPLFLSCQADIVDFGDAPESYGSANHEIDGRNYLGGAPDGEPANQPSPEADADDLQGYDDEDGVSFPELSQGTTVTVPVKISGFAYLNVWIDWNGDGDFKDSGERVISDNLRITGTAYLSVTVPGNAVISKPTFARFRFGPRSTSKPTYGSSGSATYGEVEDYMIKILCLPPNAPSVGEIMNPNCEGNTGSVVLNGLPETGTWTLTRLPDNTITTGTGPTTTISGLNPGTYNFTVTNANGCTSQVSSDVVISLDPGSTPSVIITDPAPVCAPGTADLTAEEITSGSTEDLIYSYWTDAAASIPYNTPEEATEGTYFIKGTTATGCSAIEPVTVSVYQRPKAFAGDDQVLEFLFTTKLDAVMTGANLTGNWSVITGSGQIAVPEDPKATVTNLSPDENVLSWTVTNGVCPPSVDYMLITVKDLVIPTLITPDMNGKNDYFVIKGIETFGKTSLTVCDRRGAVVYETEDYNNNWSGFDYSGNQLPNDTYFFLLKPGIGRSIKGYIV